MNIASESGLKDDQNTMVYMSRNDDEKNNDDDDDNNNDRFLEEMLAKAARLANEMKEISTKQSTTTTSSKSSTGKDAARRSLPKVINVQPSDDYTARSDCSSLGYSLATTTPSVFVVNHHGTSNQTTTPTTMNLLSTTIENCAEGYFLKSHPQYSSTTTNNCSVINEGSINNDHDEKKSCTESVGVAEPSLHIHKFGNHAKLLEVDSGSNRHQNNTENIQNMSAVDMLTSPSLRTPPKVKRTSQHQLDVNDKLPQTTSNSALQSTLLTTKSLSEEVHNNDAVRMLRKLVLPHAQERPTVLNISQNDDDYVPIADYSIRNTTTSKATNTSAVKWEIVTAPSINDDDYVSLKDYSRFPKSDKMKNQSRFVKDKYSKKSSFAQKCELFIKRRRQRKRLARRLVIVGTFITSILLYYCYRNDWFQHSKQLTFVVNYILLQLVPTPSSHIDKVLSNPSETTTKTLNERFTVESIVSIVEDDDCSSIEENDKVIDNKTLVQVEDTSDRPTNEQSQLHVNKLDDIMMIPSNALSTMDSLKFTTVTINTTTTATSESISILQPKSRQRFVEELINSMMQ